MRHHATFRNRAEKYFWWLAAAILVLAALPRAIEIINHNYLFGYDQGLFLQEVRKIAVDHKPTLIGAESGGIGGIFQGPGWHYLLSIPFLLGRGDPYAAMALMFILSLATVFLSLFLFRKPLGALGGLLVGFVLAVSPELTKHARFIWPPLVVPLITVFILFALWQGINGKKHFFPLATFLIGSLYHFEIATAATFLVTVALYVPLAWRRGIINGKILFGSWLAAAAAFLPMFIFDLRHDFLNIRGILNLFTSKNVPPFHYTNVFNNHLELFGRIVSQSFPIPVALVGFLLVVSIVGWYKYLRSPKVTKPQRTFVFFLGTFPFTLFAVFLLYRNHLWEWWLYPVSVTLCFFLGSLFSFWISQKRWVWVVGLILLLFFINYTRKTVEFYSYDLHDYGGVHKIKGKLAALDTIYQDAAGSSFGLLVFTPPIYTYVYDYLTWWYGQRRYQYVPHQEKRGTVYLLIEPDLEKPWRHQGWLETVIKDGAIIWKKELPSGFLIEKRLFPPT